MARELEQVQQEYSLACSELGQLVYRRSIMQEDVEKADYEIEKLQNKIKGLNQEGSKLMASKSNAAVELPSEPEASNE